MPALVLLVLLLLANPADAGPLDAPGYRTAFTCSACHGFGGNSRARTVNHCSTQPATKQHGRDQKRVRQQARVPSPPLAEPFPNRAVRSDQERQVLAVPLQVGEEVAGGLVTVNRVRVQQFPHD